MMLRKFDYWMYFLWRYIWETPYQPGQYLELLPPPDGKHWKKVFQEPLIAVSVERIPITFDAEWGFWITVQCADGKVATLHEKWVATPLRNWHYWKVIKEQHERVQQEQDAHDSGHDRNLVCAPSVC